ncbi:MAG: MMPL family transporter [Desulfobacterales bacterium]|nr:MMPL family transporter [Desulfobacterales bacterium]
MFLNFLMTGARHRTLTLLFLAVITWAAATGLTQLRVDTGFTSLVPDNHPDRRLYEQVIREFGTDDRIIVYAGDEQLLTLEKLAVLEQLHNDLEDLAFVRRVEDIFTIRSIRGSGSGVDGSGARIDSGMVMNGAPKTRAELDKAIARIKHHPFLAGNLISDDGKAMAILVSVYGKGEHTSADINGEMESVLSRFHGQFNRLFQVGEARVNTELTAVLFKDLRLLAPLSAGILVFSILVFMRSGFAALVPLITSGMSIVWTFGIMGWLSIPLNILSAMLPSLIVVIGSTEDTHMMAAYFQGLGSEEPASGATRRDRRYTAARFMMRHLAVPVLLTLVTTALGFAANMVNTLGMIREFALAATIAVLANGFITITLVPLALSVAGPLKASGSPHSRGAADGMKGLPGLFVKMFVSTGRRFPGTILLTTAILCGFSLYAGKDLGITNDPLSYFRQDQPLIEDVRTIHRHLAGMKFFYITLTADPETGEDRPFLVPDNIRKLSEIQNFMEKQGVFDSSLSLADQLSFVNREFNNGDPKAFKVPATRELTAQYLTFFHRRDIKNYVSHDLTKACIVVRHQISDASRLNAYVSELAAVIPEIAGPGMRTHIVGENLMINAAARELVAAQAGSLALLVGVIFIITSVMFTSFRGGVVALIPCLIPVMLMFGTMGLLGISLNPGTAMVAVISIGIAIDGTLHLFARYNALCRRTSDYEGAVLDTVRQEAVPMVTTSLALALGFGILLYSDFTIIAQFGALAAATMIAALFANLFITPIIMSKVRLVGLYEILTLKMRRDVLEDSPLFRGMTHYQIRKAILISELNTFEKGDLLIEKGSTGRSMYLILSGGADVLRRTKEEERCLAKLGPGQIFGEIGFVREIRRTADVRATSEMEVLRFDYKKLEADLKFFPYIVSKLNFNISRILGERLADTNDALDGRLETQEELPDLFECKAPEDVDKG